MRHASVLGIAAVAAALAAGMQEGAEIVPRDMLSGEPLFPRPRRPETSGAFGGSSRYPTKGRAKPAGFKLARKAARGKL